MKNPQRKQELIAAIEEAERELQVLIGFTTVNDIQSIQIIGRLDNLSLHLDRDMYFMIAASLADIQRGIIAGIKDQLRHEFGHDFGVVMDADGSLTTKDTDFFVSLCKNSNFDDRYILAYLTTHSNTATVETYEFTKLEYLARHDADVIYIDVSKDRGDKGLYSRIFLEKEPNYTEWRTKLDKETADIIQNLKSSKNEN